MIEAVDYTIARRKTKDEVLLGAYLQQLVGQPFLGFRFSYGDELTLHLGKPAKFASPKLQHLVKGSYVLGTMASGWYIREGGKPVVVLGRAGSPATTRSKIELEHSTSIKKGCKVASASVTPIHDTQTVSSFGLALAFANGATFSILPHKTDAPANENDIADWELFTPSGYYLRVGPGAVWSYLPSRKSNGSKSK